MARRRVACAQPAGCPAADHPRHRSARDLPHARRADRAADRRPGHRADDRDPSRAPDDDDRHAQEPGRQRRSGVRDLSGAGHAPRRRRGDGWAPSRPAVAACRAARSRGPAADRTRPRHLCAPAPACRPYGVARNPGLRRLAAGRGAGHLAGPALSGAGRTRPSPAALALSGRVGAGGGRTRSRGRARGPATRDRRLVRADGGRGRRGALGPDAASGPGRAPAAAARRLCLPPGRRQPPPPRLALTTRDRGAGSRRDAARRRRGAREQSRRRSI